jgi:hypothetical protein
VLLVQHAAGTLVCRGIFLVITTVAHVLLKRGNIYQVLLISQVALEYHTITVLVGADVNTRATLLHYFQVAVVHLQ